MTLIETNVQGIQWLFEDAYQDIPCEACYKLMGVRPTLVAMFTDPLSIWIVYGSNVDKAGEETLNKIFRGKTLIEPIILPSHDHLRQEVAARIKNRLNKLNELLEIEDATYLAEHWKDFPPSIFAAAAVALTSPIPGVQFGVRQDDEGNLPSTGELLANIGFWQAKIWWGLCLWWFPDRERLTTLEEDLQEVIDPAFILPGALETFISFVDKMQNSKDILPISRYILEAIRASLYANVGLPNPEADFWALAFFDYELFNRRNESDLPVKYRTTVISEERARKTISFRSAWNAVIELRREIDALVDKNMQLSLMEYLQQIAEKAGHPDLLYQMMQQGEVIGADQELPLDAFIQAMQQAIEKLGQEDVPLVAFSSIARYLVADGRIADLEKFSVALIEALGGGYDNQARVEAWLGRYLKEAREPYRLINRIGAQPRVWEYSIDKSKRVALWTERSNALRLMDRKDEALEIAQQVRSLLDDQDDPDTIFTADLNVGILLRETGAQDKSLAVLVSLLSRDLNDFQRLMALNSIATTYLDLGQVNQCIAYGKEALTLAVGPLQDAAPQIRAGLASSLSGESRYEEAVEILQGLSISDTLPAPVLLGAASAWLNIFVYRPELCSQETQKLLLESLSSLAKTSEQDGDITSYLVALRILTLFLDRLKAGNAQDLWQIVYEEHARYDRPQHPQTIFSLATFLYQQGRVAEGRKVLSEADEALSLKYKSLDDIGMAAESTSDLHHGLNRLKETVIFGEGVGADFEDYRLISELSRDALGRVKRSRSRGGSPDSGAFLPMGGLDDDTLRGLAQSTGSLGVLEWLEAAEYIFAMLTVISPSGEVVSTFLDPLDIDIYTLSKNLRSRLKNWRPSRKGDPFDLEDWHQLEAWFKEQIGQHLPVGDQLICIPNEYFAGIPWHVAATPYWSCSFIASWSSIFALGQHPKPVNRNSLGLAFVPRFRESSEVLQALQQSAQQHRLVADQLGTSLVAVEGALCDRTAFERMMTQVAVAKILCHGFVDIDGEVAFMLAHQGSLPLADSVAAGGEIGRQHRLSWRDLQNWPATPQVVFSAACSSGMSRLAGLGERLGIYNALVPHGTRALIAPEWDIVAEAVLPVLDDCINRYLVDEMPLGAALFSACRAAEQHLPRWLAWALVLEGDWR